MADDFISGSWWVHSKKDARWNATGRDIVGGKTMPEKCREKIDELKKELGEPPNDLEWGYIKN